MVTWYAVNVAVQLASHSCPTNISDELPRFGKICAVCAALGKWGVATMVSWLGSLT